MTRSYTTQHHVDKDGDCTIYWTGSEWSPLYKGDTIVCGYAYPSSFKSGGAVMFKHVNLQRDADIKTAKLKVLSHVWMSQSEDMFRSKVRAELTDDADPFTTAANYFGRDRTTAYVEWNTDVEWINEQWYESPNIKDVIQELVDEFGGLYDATIVIFWDDHDGLSDAVIGTQRSAYPCQDYRVENAMLYLDWESAIPLYDQFDNAMDFKYEVSEKEIFNDVRFMIPRYGMVLDEEVEPPVWVPIDYIYRRLDGESVAKYGRRTKYSKHHLVNKGYGPMLTARDLEKHHEPYPEAKLTMTNINSDIMDKILRTKVSNRIDYDEQTWWVDGLTLKLSNVVQAEYALVGTRPIEYDTKIFEIDIDDINGEAIIG